MSIQGKTLIPLASMFIKRKMYLALANGADDDDDGKDKIDVDDDDDYDVDAIRQYRGYLFTDNCSVDPLVSIMTPN